MLMLVVSVGAACSTLTNHCRKVGLQSYTPAGVQKVLNEVSLFDILVEVIVHRTFSKKVTKIVTPFFHASNLQEAKRMLREELSPDLREVVFRKVRLKLLISQ